LLGSNYVSNNVAIFDLISNNTGEDAVVNILNWNDIPDSNFPTEKLIHVNKTGSFNDINILVFRDLSDEEYYYGVIKKEEITKIQQSGGSGSGSGSVTYSYNYTISAGGKDYSYKSPDDLGGLGSVVRVKIVNNSINTILNGVTLGATCGTVSAVDPLRIRANATTYWLSSNVAVYFEDSQGNFTQKSLSDIITNAGYSLVSIYLDKAQINGGKVVAIVVVVP
jgi:hypothetical protein